MLEEKVTVIVWVRWASAAESSSWNRDKAWARGRAWYRTFSSRTW